MRIRLETCALRSQAHFNAINLGQRPLELMVQNQDLADVVVQCDSDPAAVSAANWLRCGNYYFMQFNAWEYFYYQRGDEAIPIEIDLWSQPMLVSADPGRKLKTRSTNRSAPTSCRSSAGRVRPQSNLPGRNESISNGDRPDDLAFVKRFV